MMELLTSKMGHGNIRVALFDSGSKYAASACRLSTHPCAASTYTLNTLRSEDDRFEVALYLVRQVRPQAGAHVAVQVAEMIANNIKEYE